MQGEQQQRIMGYFIEEAKDHLNTLEQGLLNLQATIQDAEMLNEVFRAAHSVKGGAAMLGLTSIQQTAHRLEDHFKVLKEQPIQIDRDLESLFLQVFDTLVELLDHLQSSFGLTPDIGDRILKEAEPTFRALSEHLNRLIQDGGVAPDDMPTILHPLHGEDDNQQIKQTFQQQVPQLLREMLDCFKQADTPQGRQTLETLCDRLYSLGEPLGFEQWCALISAARNAVAVTGNSYRDLAPILIRDIKQAQDLIVADHPQDITVGSDLHNLLPAPDAVVVPGLQDLEDMLGESDAVAPLDPPGLETPDWLDTPVSATEQPLAPRNGQGMRGGADLRTEFGDGPQVGPVELSTLSELFESEVADLEQWNNEEIADFDHEMAAGSDLSAYSDFSDLLFEDPEDSAPEGTLVSDDLTNLLSSELDEFETDLPDSLLPEAAADATAAPSAPPEDREGQDDFSDILAIGATESGTADLDLDQFDLEMSAAPAPADSEAIAPESAPSASDPAPDPLASEFDESADLEDFSEFLEQGDLATGGETAAAHPPTDEAWDFQDLDLGNEFAAAADPGAAAGPESDLDVFWDLGETGAETPAPPADPTQDRQHRPKSLDDFSDQQTLSDIFETDAALNWEELDPESDSALNWALDSDSQLPGTAPADQAMDATRAELSRPAMSDPTTDRASSAASDGASDRAINIDGMIDDLADLGDGASDDLADLLDLEETPIDTAIDADANVADLFEDAPNDNRSDWELSDLNLSDLDGEDWDSVTADPGLDDGFLNDGFLDDGFLDGNGLSEIDDTSPPVVADAEADADLDLDFEGVAADLSDSEHGPAKTPEAVPDLDLDWAALQVDDQRGNVGDNGLDWDHADAGGDRAIADLDSTNLDSTNLDSTNLDIASLDIEGMDAGNDVDWEGALDDADFGADFAVNLSLDDSAAPNVAGSAAELAADPAADSAPEDWESDLDIDPQALDTLDDLLDADPAAETQLPASLAQHPTDADQDWDDLTQLVSDAAHPADVADGRLDAQSIDDLGDLISELGADVADGATDVDEINFDDLEVLLSGDSHSSGGDTATQDGDPDVVSPIDALVQSYEASPAKPAPAKTSLGHHRRWEQTIKVPVRNLDTLNNLVGELVVNRNSLEQSQERLRQSLENLMQRVQQLGDVGQRMQDLYERSLLELSLLASRREGASSFTPAGSTLGADPATPTNRMGLGELELDRFTPFHTQSQEIIELIVRVRESASDIDFVVDETDQMVRNLRQITTKVQEGLTKSRMVPFSNTADRLPRAVRNVSLEFGKQVDLQVEGKDTMIDKMIAEQLYDPITHLVNNAITHGIETPEERQAAGKNPTGRLLLRSFYQGNQTVISISDDGAGIDTERVKAKAIDKGLITPERAKRMARSEVYDLLFQPGFSTKDSADNFAGRGVGMDVVRRNIQELRGTVTTDSTVGKGTTFTVRLPLNLSICKALRCISDHATIAFPMDGVEDMFDVPADQAQQDKDGNTCIRWRDRLLPFRPLTELFKYQRVIRRSSVYGGTAEEDSLSIVILRSAGEFAAIQVDRVLGEQEIVIKQPEGPIPKPMGIAGMTVLGDGRVMPIADVLELIDLSQGRLERQNRDALWNMPEDVEPEAPAEKTEPMVLIVDDSITVRELLKMTFLKSGYQVAQARDGQEAWEKLRSGLPCDIVFCDIEMPRMDGLEFLSRVQKEDSLSHLPVAMLTSRGADKHRKMAIDLGARGYFTKPYLEEALLDAAQRMLKGEVLVNSVPTA